MLKLALASGALAAAVMAADAQRAPAVPPAATPPKLVVLLVVDQMRADYVTRFRHDWTGGLRRLLTDGAWFSNVAYPYLITFTCPGHATIATGAFPRTHGVFQNEWYSRELGRPVTCTEDAQHRNIGYYEGATRGDSPAALRVPTFAEELRRQKGARVASMALKARSAIMIVGAAGHVVTWLGTSRRGWETSTAFSRTPVASVSAFVRDHPIELDFGRTWDRLLPAPRYELVDEGESEAPPAGWTRSFPHPIQGAGDAETRVLWEMSPYPNEYLADLAGWLVEAEKLGQGSSTDLLAVGFSSPDLAGHAFGPQSHELQDTYLRLDATIGWLLDRLDALVGRGRYVVALGSDHGVADIPEQARSEGRDAGRMSSARLTTDIDAAAQAALGPGKYVARVMSSDVYFEPGMYEKLQANPTAMTAVVNAIEQQPGVAAVHRKEALREGSSTADERRRPAALSYVEGRSGDMTLVVKPGWIFRATGTTHGSPNSYDQRVPLILMGPGVKAGAYDDRATPADLAPTLAKLLGVAMPSAEGRPLTAALSP